MVPPQLWVVQKDPFWPPLMTWGRYGSNTESKYSGGVSSEDASSMTMTQSVASDSALAYPTRWGVTAFSHASTLSGSIMRVMSTFSMPSRLLMQAMGPFIPATRNRSSSLARMPAASRTVLTLWLSKNSAGEARSPGTSVMSPSPRNLEPATDGWEDLFPGLISHPKASASTVMQKGTRTVANPNILLVCRARRAIFSASKLASGHSAPHASICPTVPVWVKMAGGWASLPLSSKTLTISSLEFMCRNVI